jgi:ribosomal protein S18 acetylase RimI-like enzyme
MHAPMTVRIVEDDVARLSEYARVPIAFEVREAFDDRAVAALLAGTPAVATAVPAPYVKDYDSYPDNRPTDWARQFDVSRWTILAAFSRAGRIGGAVVVREAPELDLLQDCPGCALLWDLRVAPEARRQGVGAALLRAAEAEAVHRGARALRVETQQVNVPACRFYGCHGYRLERAVRGAYRELPSETQLIWRKELDVASLRERSG